LLSVDGGPRHMVVNEEGHVRMDSDGDLVHDSTSQD
jgi:hypothetical protein